MRSKARGKAPDLLVERSKLEKAHPGLVTSYAEFLRSFAAYRKATASFEKTGEEHKQQRPAARAR
jgi:hypothetical protein